MNTPYTKDTLRSSITGTIRFLFLHCLTYSVLALIICKHFHKQILLLVKKINTHCICHSHTFDSISDLIFIHVNSPYVALLVKQRSYSTLTGTTLHRVSCSGKASS